MKPIWTCENGTKIPVEDLADEHLLNIIFFLQRQAAINFRDLKHVAYSAAHSLQGEMAQYYADQEIDRLEEMSAEEFLKEQHPIYKDLLVEAKRRSLITDQ